MKISVVISRALSGGFLAFGVALAGAAGGGTTVVAEGLAGASGLVGNLAELADLEPLPVVDESSSAVRPTGVKASVRQSVPVRDRAETYRSAEIFRNSRVAMPLLVADLEPKTMAVVRPMSGRSVGARPAAAWTRPAVEPAPAGNAMPVSGTSWAVQSRR